MTPKRRLELTSARDETVDPIARRQFMQLMGAALGLAGVEGCTRAPTQEIVPYVVQPPETKPGRPRFYASATVLDGYATGVLVESHEGRPTKVEGNPDHPASLGASGVFDQASVLGVYDPRRARGTKKGELITSWDSVRTALRRGPWTEARGRGLHLVLPPTSSPSVAALLAELRARWPEARVHFQAAASRQNAWEGARLALGAVLEPRLELAQADVVVALDADFLASGRANLRLARQFADGRRLTSPTDAMNRLYVVEPLVTITGAAADHRLRVRAHDVVAIAAALFAEVGKALGAAATAGARSALDAAGRLAPAAARHGRFVTALARDLVAHRGRSAVLAGDAQPAVVHAMVHALNDLLGNVGKTVRYAASPVLEAGEPSHDSAPLADALAHGEVDTLLVLGTNAAYASSGDRPLGGLLARARQSAYLGLYADETATACTYRIAEAHPLESWGDARAFDGSVSIVQPLIAPLFGGRTTLDVLALYTRPATTTAYDIVREQAKLGAPPGEAAAETRWRRALTRGVLDETATPTVTPVLGWAAIARALQASAASVGRGDDGLEIVFPLDLRVHDGRFADNAWLLELPASITKLTWENAATLAPETAAPLGIVTGDELELRFEERSVRAPALVVPGQAAGSVGLALGWGRTHADALSRGLGVDAFALRSARAPFMGRGLVVTRTGKRCDLAFAQTHQKLEGRDEEILQHRTLEELRLDPGASAKNARRPLPLYDVRPGPAPHQWGMAIDLGVCTGCSACVVACQAENNVPTVGKDGVAMGRIMHWIRIDTYFDGDVRSPQVLNQPMLCQHCEKAPCEYVCPTNATVHSEDGLNQMVYNRCVGTRFCSNNCPYKVRRFNWFDFHHDESETEQLVHNPDVTVRERGVMEKCTFCVQRIREAEIHDAIAPSTRAPPRAPLQTACQQACAPRAITFGDLQDPTSEVSRLHANDRAFAVLNDLGTVPRVRYLARVTNPNPELA